MAINWLFRWLYWITDWFCFTDLVNSKLLMASWTYPCLDDTFVYGVNMILCYCDLTYFSINVSLFYRRHVCICLCVCLQWLNIVGYLILDWDMVATIPNYDRWQEVERLRAERNAVANKMKGKLEPSVRQALVEEGRMFMNLFSKKNETAIPT